MALSPGLARWLASRGCDAVHASTLGLARAPDVDILAWAFGDGRIVVTADLDYPRLLALSSAVGPAVILFRGGNWSEQQAIDRLSAVLALIPEDQLSQSLVVIERARIRRRALPI
jgi:predicted nuclease of predicted toxin-antitoxin system